MENAPLDAGSANSANIAKSLALLRCTETGEALDWRDGALVSKSGRRYGIDPSGVPIFADTAIGEDASRQKAHYDMVADAYAKNIAYPHTIAYQEYLDAAVFDAIGDASLGTLAEVCCGTGAASQLLAGRYARSVGVDISTAMLARAVQQNSAPAACFVQGDATRLPLADASFDTVAMLGGIHHVNDRAALFREVARVLKPGGHFLFREPVSDFILWRALRAVVYRLSPMLDHATERPLLRRETQQPLDAAGLQLTHWSTHGFFGFCIFMNSDVLVFNRLFRFVPGIAALTRASTKLDAWTLRLPGLSNAGLQVVGIARKPG